MVALRLHFGISNLFTKEEVEFLKSQIVILETDENMSSQIATSNIHPSDLKSQIVTSSWGGQRLQSGDIITCV